MPMESKLLQLIDLAEVVTDIREQTEDTPVVLRHTIEQLSQTIAIVCSQVEPINMVLPLNVVWICYKIESPFYRKAFKRVSKSNTTNSLPFQQEWTQIYFYKDTQEIQFFDDTDLALFDIPEVPLATNLNLGKTKINQSAEDPSVPSFIGTTDIRMSDAREPIDHVHFEKPASQLLSGTTALTIDTQASPQPGQTLVFTGTTSVGWQKINESSIEEANYNG